VATRFYQNENAALMRVSAYSSNPSLPTKTTDNSVVFRFNHLLIHQNRTLCVSLKYEITRMGKKTFLTRWVAKTSGYQKLFVSLILALCASAAMWPLQISTVTRVLFLWDVFAISMISMMWLLFFTTTVKEQREIVKKQDDAIPVIFGIVVTAVCVSFMGSLLLVLSSNEPTLDKELNTTATLIAITSSWILLHTIFTIRYAHLYLDSSIVKTANGDGGLDFPNAEIPDYIDFAYFSFVIGMTFQVSDVTISSKTIRRYVLLHSLISFIFNTIIVALTVNIIAGLSR